MSVDVTLYEQTEFPIFQNRMYDTEAEARACTRGDIRLVQDGASGLVHNAAFDADVMHYDTAYQNEQAHSTVFQSHLDQVAGIVRHHLGTDHLVEVGCGKAYFLELLQSQGVSIRGFDPTYEGVNPAIEKRYFGEGTTIAAEGIVLRHVLEHIQNPVEFLVGLRDVNGGGLIYIEVPCLDWILDNNAWFDIFYEHVNYFRLSDLERIFGRVIAGGHLFGGQYIYVVADLATIGTPQRIPGDEVTLPPGFLESAVGPAHRTAQAKVVWGAASKGVIYSLLRERSGNPVSMVVDINPAKCGKYLPATGLCVTKPEDAINSLADGSDICVMNSNYVEEIRRITQGRFNLVGVGRE